MNLKFFSTPAAFRTWLEQNHDRKRELMVGYYKKHTGRPSITWEESVAEALCFGWIDGIRRRVDDDSYSIRFTPRTAKSTWSSVNIRTMNKLIAEGRACPPGVAAFERRTKDNSEIYSYENRHTLELDAESERLFKRNKVAWKNFQALPNWYRRLAIYRVMSPKRPETKAKRLNEFIARLAKGEPIPELARTPSKRPASRGRAGKA